MSALWTAAEAARATGGTARGDWQATGLSIDSRSVAPGELFVALKDQRDGHDFVADALAKGAAGALVSRIPDGIARDAPLLIVPDVLAALDDLGRAGRARTTARVIAVTGSVGKTSVKEMLRTALAPQGRVHAAEKSFNNHWGVPLTLARCPRDAEFAIIEIGMNHPGEIAPLAALAAPDVALVTIVAAAHLAAFDDLDGIAREKAAIFSGLNPGGVAVLNAGLDTSPILEAAAGAAGARLLRFGSAEGCDGRLLGCHLRAEATGIEAVICGTQISFDLPAPGRHFALNAVAALSAAWAAGADVARAAAALAGWHPPAGRGTRERVQIADGSGAFELIDDAYNANPTSLAAALEVLAAGSPAGRRIAILGDMLELGPDEAALHAAIADLPAVARIDLVHGVGPRMRHLIDALPATRRGIWAESANTLAGHADMLAGPGDLVLVKGSNGSRVSRVASVLRGRALAPELQREG